MNEFAPEFDQSMYTGEVLEGASFPIPVVRVSEHTVVLTCE